MTAENLSVPRYRCPYCHAGLAELPAGGICGACGRVMRLPTASTPEARRERRRKRERLAREAERVKLGLHRAPDVSLLTSPRALFVVMLMLAVAGSLVIHSARKTVSRREVRPELPHRKALRQLDTLATALGRYRFHVGDYPPDAPGLRALLNDPGTPGWNGPYINQLIFDPWGTPYQYARAGDGGVRLFTCGPDRKPGTPDDLRPDTLAFDPGTAWTTGWVRASERLPGVRILPQGPSDGKAPDGRGR
ncbi:MAG: type II secretion system protein GspG [Kiritimatiellae bacterium]|nr:type II secretion system protein GspG [Kiritimatiellia bacterium]